MTMPGELLPSRAVAGASLTMPTGVDVLIEALNEAKGRDAS